MSASGPKPCGFVVATRMEANPIIQALHLKLAGRKLYKSDSGRIWLAISGVGKENARQASYRLCDSGVKELISAGFCGALVPDAKIGEVITDRIATAAQPVVTPRARQLLSERAGARAVDMETQAVIEAGTRRGVPIRVLRVVGDACSDDLTPLLGSDGDFSPARIACRLLNPAAWPLALRLWRQSRIAREVLGRTVIEACATPY